MDLIHRNIEYKTVLARVENFKDCPRYRSINYLLRVIRHLIRQNRELDAQIEDHMITAHTREEEHEVELDEMFDRAENAEIAAAFYQGILQDMTGVDKDASRKFWFGEKG